jgi:hypothetical protein
MAAHTIAEQLRELAGARQLAYAVITRPDATPDARDRARSLMADIRAARFALICRLGEES